MNSKYGNNRSYGLCRQVYITFVLVCVSAMLFAVASYAAEPLYGDVSIKQKAEGLFGENMPGLCNLLQYHDDAHMFELASGVAVNEVSPVVGFNLQMNVVNKKDATVCIDGVKRSLKDTELDLITKDYAIECKSGMISKETVKQLEKEHTFLQWCKVLCEEIKTRQVAIKCIKGSKRPIFVVCGPSTYNKEFRVVCSWIDYSCEYAIQEFINIIRGLAQIRLVAFFKKDAQAFKGPLQKFVSSVLDNISYENGYDIKKTLV